MPRPTSVPKLTLHKASGKAVVRLNGRDHYLGVYGSPEAKAAYDRLIAEWLAAGRRDPEETARAESRNATSPRRSVVPPKPARALSGRKKPSGGSATGRASSRRTRTWTSSV
ncbi:MAG TPA: hypothetical protein VMZ71_01465 [Gemmataceae bacterium]|nr:hypothetical protein [Gemmataceae bacterium]